MKTTSSCTDSHPQTSWEVFIGPSSNLIMLSLDDETLPIINKPKLPPPPKREQNKEQNERV
jgi:hypothetical protein